MFVVKPINDKDMQKEICSALAVAYRPESLAYYAANLAEDKETVAEIIGICQFTIGETGKIIALTCSPDFVEDEAMIVLCRAAMYFMYRIGIQKVEMLPEAGPREILSKTGFLLQNNIYVMDLETFYRAPCKYKEE